jgi:hypothetical protein
MTNRPEPSEPDAVLGLVKAKPSADLGAGLDQPSTRASSMECTVGTGKARSVEPRNV